MENRIDIYKMNKEYLYALLETIIEELKIMSPMKGSPVNSLDFIIQKYWRVECEAFS